MLTSSYLAAAVSFSGGHWPLTWTTILKLLVVICQQKQSFSNAGHCAKGGKHSAQ